MSFGLVVISVLSLISILFYQKQRLAPRLDEMVTHQAFDEAAKLVQTVYHSCRAAENQSQTELGHNLEVAHAMLNSLGQVSLSDQPVEWLAENQISHQTTAITLPRLLAGSNWFGQNFATNVDSLLVDQIKRFTRSDATVFQRMNPEGDMLRICTSLLRTNGSRAVGTYISKTNPD